MHFTTTVALLSAVLGAQAQSYDFKVWSNQELATAPNGGFSPHQEQDPCFVIRITDSSGNVVAGAKTDSDDDTNCATFVTEPDGAILANLKYTEISCDHAVGIPNSNNIQFCTDGGGKVGHFPGLTDSNGNPGWCNINQDSGDDAVGQASCTIGF